MFLGAEVWVSPWIEKSEVMAWPVVVTNLRNEANVGMIDDLCRRR